MQFALPPLVVMGVSGSGKSTIGSALAARLGLVFVDGDDLHSAENRSKMASGIPLDDADRAPWLESVGETLSTGRAGVVACSALKRSYRDAIRCSAPGTFFVHLVGETSVLEARLGGRSHEYMPATLLQSQLQILEPLNTDESGCRMLVTLPPDVVVARVLHVLKVD